VKYGYQGTMRTKPGRRDEVVALLLRDVEALRDAGCESYVVGVAADEPDTIYVTEVWQSGEHHAASLRLPSAKAAIAAAMPLLTGEFTSRELDIVGGLGVG
jgi:quinol monooxygenase YgiN